MISLIIAATLYLFFTLFEPKASAWMEVLTIYGGVVLATLLSAYSEYKQEKQFLKIKDEINNTVVTVYRGQYGVEDEILVRDLVVGDIISVQQGDIVPADCILIEEMNITVNESKYRENAECVEKEPSALNEYPENDDERDNHTKNPDNCLLSGSMVMSGGGKAVILAVGDNTSLGRMGNNEELLVEGTETPLKKKL